MLILYHCCLLAECNIAFLYSGFFVSCRPSVICSQLLVTDGISVGGNAIICPFLFSLRKQLIVDLELLHAGRS